MRDGPIRINGFTDEELSWAPWLETVPLDTATPEPVFNAIMFAPGGLPRAERELCATAESVVNGCVYGSSVHARRFEHLAGRSDVVEQLFDDPQTAGTTGRETAIVAFSILLAQTPEAVTPAHVRVLTDVGLTELEVHDLVHAVALVAWANRLTLNLGEAVSG
jgi:uncharacterized peroxidase-related enzyme